MAFKAKDAITAVIGVWGKAMKRPESIPLLGGAGLALLLLLGNPAMAACGDYAAGARTGAQILANPITEADQVHDPALLDKYRNSCIIAWKGGARGAAGRAEDEARCRSIPGASVLEFMPDHGSNFNTCVFAPSDDGSPGSTNPNSSEEPIVPSTPPPIGSGSGSTPKPSPPPPPDYGSYNAQFCNRTSNPIVLSVQRYLRIGSATETVSVTEGWWSIAAGMCTIVSGPLESGGVALLSYHAHGKSGYW